MSEANVVSPTTEGSEVERLVYARHGHELMG